MTAPGALRRQIARSEVLARISIRGGKINTRTRKTWINRIRKITSERVCKHTRRTLFYWRLIQHSSCGNQHSLLWPCNIRIPTETRWLQLGVGQLGQSCTLSARQSAVTKRALARSQEGMKPEQTTKAQHCHAEDLPLCDYRTEVSL